MVFQIFLGYQIRLQQTIVKLLINLMHIFSN